jgi:hypothetical protein
MTTEQDKRPKDLEPGQGKAGMDVDDAARRRLLRSAALIVGGAVCGSAAVQAMQPAPAPTAPSLSGTSQIGVGTGQVITARSLGARGDGTGDDGAILTAAIERMAGTLASSQSRSPIVIEFGDSRFVYRLVTPIVVQQNHICLSGNGAVLQCAGQSAIIGDHDAAANILFGFQVCGFVLHGSTAGDAIVIRSGSQCKVENIRNYATVGGAIVALQGTISSQTRSIKSDGELGAACWSLVREAIYEKTRGRHFNCIANRHEDLLGYYCAGAGVLLDESDAFHIAGDFEKCRGPGVDLLNSRFGTVSIYTEVNGQGATLRGDDTPDDIRIRSADGTLISRSSNILVTQTVSGGAQVRGASPNSVHIMNADECLIVHNFLGGNIRIEPGSKRNNVGMQARFIGQFIDQGEGTVSMLPRAASG